MFIDVAHDIPGRIRFAIPALKGCAARGRALGGYVEAITGVAAARVNPLTGSLIVDYDGAARTRERIFATLHAAGFRLHPRVSMHGSAKSSSSWDATMTGVFSKTLVRMIAEEALHFAVLAII
jgi:hypothetical protein